MERLHRRRVQEASKCELEETNLRLNRPKVVSCQDLSQSEDPANGGLPSTRRTRGTKGGTSSEQPPALHYLGYENTLAQR